MPVPQYDPRRADAAFQLRYSWMGWASDTAFATQPIELIEQTRPLWEADGLRVLESRWTTEPITAMTFQDESAGKQARRYYIVAVDALGQEGFPSSPVWFQREWRDFYLPFIGEWHQ